MMEKCFFSLSLLVLLMMMISVDYIYAQEQLAGNMKLVAADRTADARRYPNIGSEPFPLLVGRELDQVNEALTLAKTLTADCRCDQALKGYGVESLGALLQLEVNENVFDGRRSTLGLPWLMSNGERATVASYFTSNRDWIWAGVIQARFTGKGNIIFLNNYFFNPNRAATSALSQRAITLIHESVHQFGNKDDQYFGGSRRLTILITEACLPGLKAQAVLPRLTR